MRPQERRREFLRSQGYLIVRNFVPVDEIARARTAQDAYYQGESNTKPSFNWPHPRPCKARSRKHPYASFFRSEFSDLLRDGRLATLIRETFSLKEIRFWHDQLLYEEPRPSGEENYHWHREESRWLTCHATQMLTAWIPLIDFTAEMGPITIMVNDEPRRMSLKAGDLVLFPSTTLHGNPLNLGEKPRRALAAHFASADLTYRPNVKFSHVNERLVQKTNGIPDFQDPAVCPLLGARD
jgi:ectoine hydroxylase-related dioxygenase (phytanoyl-CoA dioxygenase family)